MSKSFIPLTDANGAPLMRKGPKGAYQAKIAAKGGPASAVRKLLQTPAARRGEIAGGAVMTQHKHTVLDERGSQTLTLSKEANGVACFKTQGGQEVCASKGLAKVARAGVGLARAERAQATASAKHEPAKVAAIEARKPGLVQRVLTSVGIRPKKDESAPKKVGGGKKKAAALPATGTSDRHHGYGGKRAYASW